MLGRAKIEAAVKDWIEWLGRDWLEAWKGSQFNRALGLLAIDLGKAIATPVVLWLCLVVLVWLEAPKEMIQGGVRLAIAVTVVAPLICLRSLWVWFKWRFWDMR